MREFLEKQETGLSIALIVLYVVINSYCRKNFGTTDYRSALIITLLSLVVVVLIFVLNRRTYYGLTKVKNAKAYLYFIPLVFIATVNLWNGIHIENTPMELLFHVITMVNAGFLEEIVFRGFLFKMMEKDNVKTAMRVSALTFGIGHIANLLTGADVVQTLMQICYATAIGFLFVIIFYKSKSLVPCIITHAIVNVLSIVNGDMQKIFYFVCAFLTIMPLAYAWYINKRIKENA